MQFVWFFFNTSRIYFMLLASNLVDVLQRQSQRLVSRSLRRVDVVEGIHDGHAAVVLLILLRHFPALEPRHLRTTLKHVVAVPAGHRHEWHPVRVVADLLDVGRHFLLDLVVARLSAQLQLLCRISMSAV